MWCRYTCCRAKPGAYISEKRLHCGGTSGPSWPIRLLEHIAYTVSPSSLSLAEGSLSDWFAARWSVLTSHGSNLWELLFELLHRQCRNKASWGGWGVWDLLFLRAFSSDASSFTFRLPVLLCSPSSFTPKCQPCVCTVIKRRKGVRWRG